MFSKRILLFIVLLACYFSGFLFFSTNGFTEKIPNNGIGFAFSGAGGRISQHLALMEVLLKGLNPSGIKIRPSYLSGASSGSLSAVALNAILQTEDQNISGGFNWDDMKQLVFGLTNSDVFDDSISGLEKIFTHNIFEGYILDDTPLSNYLRPFLSKMGFYRLGDLYLPTEITVVNQSSGFDVRLWSTDPRVADLNLLQVLMASTALPIVFEPRTIDDFGNNTIFIDGGTGIDTIPLTSLVENPNVKQLYIICYGSALTSGGGTLPVYLDNIMLLKNSLAVIDDMRVDFFAGALDIAMNSAVRSFAYIPDLNETFSALDFEHERYEYDLTFQWAIQHDPQPLNSFV